MPPIVALIICTAFVLFMLKLERKQSKEVSSAFWIPTIWFLVLSSKPLSIWFQSGGATIEEGNPIDRNFLTIVLTLGLIILAKRRFKLSGIIKENIWVFVLLGYMLFGCFWADEPYISFKRWTRDLIAIVMMLVMASEPNPLKALESLIRRSIYILIPFSYILINYFSEYGRMYVHHAGDLMWVGAAMHKNSLAQLCSAAIFFLTWTFFRRRQEGNGAASGLQTYLEVFLGLLSLWLMGGPNHMPTYSATASLSLIIGLVLLATLSHYKKRRGTTPGYATLAALMLIILVYGAATPMIGKMPMDVSSAVGRDETLTGRTEVWEKLIPVAMERPILGYGYSGFWTTDSRKDFAISGAHNGYLDIVLNLGFVGLLLFAVFIASNVRMAQNMAMRDFDWGAFWICSLVMVLLSNITESAFISFDSRMIVPILFLTFSYTKSVSQSMVVLSTGVQKNDSPVSAEKILYDNNQMV